VSTAKRHFNKNGMCLQAAGEGLCQSLEGVEPLMALTAKSEDDELDENQDSEKSCPIKKLDPALGKDQCVECASPAVLQCRECQHNFCQQCDRSVHEQSFVFLQQHKRTPVAGDAGAAPSIPSQIKPAAPIPTPTPRATQRNTIMLAFPPSGECYTTQVVRLAKPNDTEPLFPTIPVTKGVYCLSLTFEGEKERHTIMLKDIYWESSRAARAMLPSYSSIVGTPHAFHRTLCIITLTELGNQQLDPLQWQYTYVHSSLYDKADKGGVSDPKPTAPPNDEAKNAQPIS